MHRPCLRHGFLHVVGHVVITINSGDEHAGECLQWREEPKPGEEVVILPGEMMIPRVEPKTRRHSFFFLKEFKEKASNYRQLQHDMTPITLGVCDFYTPYSTASSPHIAALLGDEVILILISASLLSDYEFVSTEGG